MLILQRALERMRVDLEHGSETDAHRAMLERLQVLLHEAESQAVVGTLTVSERVHLAGLVDRLREEVLGLWAAELADLAAEDVLRSLRRLESLHRELAFLRGDDSFEGLLSVSRGPDLIVELAHDLRSPLTSVLFLSEALRRGQSGPVNELQHRQLGIIYSAALSLVSMAGDVIELARGGNRLIDRQPSPFSLADILHSISDLVQPVAEQKGLVLRVQPPPHDRFLGYPVALSRVLLNLTTNALKATEEGFVEILVRRAGPDRMELSVRDSGSGMDEETQRGLFEPFRVKPGSTKFGLSSSGLGLSICRRLVEAMGSTLHFETTPGWGTRFFFELHLPPAADV